MMKIRTLAALLAAASAPAMAQTTFPTRAAGIRAGGQVVMTCDANETNCRPVNAANPLPTSGGGGGGGAVTIADGADVAEGTRSDAASTATDTTAASVVALAKGQIVRLNGVIATLGSPLQAGGNVAVTSSALPAGAATASNQSTQITAEQAIQANQTNATQKTQIVGPAGAVPTVGNPQGTILGLGENALSVRGVPYLFNPTTNQLAIGNGDGNGAFVVMRGGGAIATGQVSVGTASTLIAAGRAFRQKITVSVGAANACTFGNSGVSATTGFALQPTAGATITLDTNAALYAVCTATTTVSFIEQF